MNNTIKTSDVCVVIHSGNRPIYFDYATFMLMQLSRFFSGDVYILTTSNIKIPIENTILWKRYGNTKILNVDTHLEQVGLPYEINDNNYTRMTFLKLVSPIIPELSIYRLILYLDTDILIKSDFSDIFKTQLGSCMFGASIDFPIQYGCNNMYRQTRLREFIAQHVGKNHVCPNELYYNCGVLLFNNEYIMQNLKVYCETLQKMHRIHYQYHFPFADQDIINISFKIATIDEIYNKQRGYSHNCQDAVFLHFIAYKNDFNNIIKNNLEGNS